MLEHGVKKTEGHYALSKKLENRKSNLAHGPSLLPCLCLHCTLWAFAQAVVELLVEVRQP